jgi:hypothetical protein
MAKKTKRRRTNPPAQSAYHALEHIIELTESATRPENIVPAQRRRKAAVPSKKRKAGGRRPK